MQKNITARHFDLTPEMKERCEAEIDGLRRYFDNIISANLVLDVERHVHRAELKVQVYNATITGSGDTNDMYNSIASAVDKVKGQLKKYKGKLKNKRPDEITETINNLTQPTTDVDELDA
jgi:putative sigma-54 modulation protein